MAQTHPTTASPRPLVSPPETDTESCPWCNQPITHEEFRRIKARIKAEERRERAKFEEQVRQQFEQDEALRIAKTEAEMEQLKEEANAAVLEVKSQVAEREAAARAEAKKATEDEMGEKLLAAQQAKLAAEEAKAEAERGNLEALNQERQKSSQILEQLGQLKKDKETAAATIVEERKQAQEREAAIRAETKTAVEMAAKSEREKTISLHVEEMQKQREALEKDKEASLNQEKAKAFAARQKLESKIGELKRQVQGQTANELGEGAEVNLYEALRDQFQDDRVNRIAKGEPGADIRHEVMLQGECCGCIVYDSKNRKAWRNDYAEKLRGDQLAAEADHALLTTSAFPSGHQQVCIQDGVIIANPARALALVEILRDHIIQQHRLRLSGQDRDTKTGQLYEFITSDRCEQLLRRSEEVSSQLLELDVKEKHAHERVWEKRGTLVRTVEKANREFRSELGRILGS